MPKFEVVVIRTRTINESLSFELSAKDEETAQERAQTIVDDLGDDGEALAKKYKTDWDGVDEDIAFEIDQVNEL